MDDISKMLKITFGIFMLEVQDVLRKADQLHNHNDPQKNIWLSSKWCLQKLKGCTIIKEVIVVSPMLALKADQVHQLVKMGIKATHLSSTQPFHSVMAQILEAKW